MYVSNLIVAKYLKCKNAVINVNYCLGGFLDGENVSVIFRPHGRTVSCTVGYFPSMGKGYNRISD